MDDEHKDKPVIPTKEQAKNKIVRMNAEGDSTFQKADVIAQAQKYDDSFFNTSRPDANFPRPVVITINAREEDLWSRWMRPRDIPMRLLHHIMFVRIRVSINNFLGMDNVIREWNCEQIPVVLTFMRYYTPDPPAFDGTFYERLLHVERPCWQMREQARGRIVAELKARCGRLVTECGRSYSYLCKDCRACEIYYWIAKYHMEALGLWE
jgi:hypothetical protein